MNKMQKVVKSNKETKKGISIKVLAVIPAMRPKTINGKLCRTV